MRIECKATDLHALIDEAWDRKQIPGLSKDEMDEDCTVCPECEGQNINDDQMRCRDCDPDLDPEEGS